MKHWTPMLVWLMACKDPEPPPCGAFDEVFVYVDADGDGFGTDEAVGWTCAPTATESTNSADCDDASPTVFPGAEEVCDQVDNDCNTRIDEGLRVSTWYEDEDGDGYGKQAGRVTSCAAPAGGWVNAGGDCDDADTEVHPGAIETCNAGVDDDCDDLADDDDPGVDPSTQVRSYRDLDGDDFGDSTQFRDACGALPGGVRQGGDCDDTRSNVNPDEEELCNRRDDDCDGGIDDADPGIDPAVQASFFDDIDGDGHGDPASVVFACERPVDTVLVGDDCNDRDETVFVEQDWLLDGDGDGIGRAGYAIFACNDPGGRVQSRLGIDCDDTDPAINPTEREICNSLVDDDCDGLADDHDPSVDPSGFLRFPRDLDRDGHGHPTITVQACAIGTGAAATTDDCDDLRFEVNPDADEVCDTLDNDCDSLTDDNDPTVDPTTFLGWYLDGDGDGVGASGDVVFACHANGRVSEGGDCDDTDPQAAGPQDWGLDLDGDGFGDPLTLVNSCVRPDPDAVPLSLGEDCDDGDLDISPGALEVCGDTIDQNCDGSDTCRSCFDILGTVGGDVDGVYEIEPSPGNLYDVWCDQTTDGGGWTLVASTTIPMDDAGHTAWFADLTTLSPVNQVQSVWSGMRDVMGARSDIRFTCQTVVGDPMTVDLSFYDTIWYDEITASTNEANVCFSEQNGYFDDPPPARRDNVSGAYLPAGDQWAYGYLEGEDSCNDSGDFTVDFDDRGMDSNQSDGTDWGEDDGSWKCGSYGYGYYYGSGAWFLFVRELP